MAKRNSQDSKGRKKPEALQAIYDRIRQDFSAADLQKYTVKEKGIPLDEVIADMEQIHKRYVEKTQRRKRA
jgi:hypothetical protein